MKKPWAVWFTEYPDEGSVRVFAADCEEALRLGIVALNADGDAPLSAVRLF